MAGDWIKIRDCLWDHPKVLTLVSMLSDDLVMIAGSSTDASVRPRDRRVTVALAQTLILGALCRTWMISDQHTTDGKLPKSHATVLDLATGLPGWSAALKEIGWLEETAQGIIIPRFDLHNSNSAKSRALHNAAQARHRHKKETLKGSSGDGAVMVDNQPEKRREENNTNTTPPPPRGGKDEHEKKQKLFADETNPVFPDGFDTAEFRAAWQEWERHRISMRKRMTATGAQKLLKEIAPLGVVGAIAAIEHSIANGYQGIFPNKDANNGTRTTGHGAGVGQATRIRHDNSKLDTIPLFSPPETERGTQKTTPTDAPTTPQPDSTVPAEGNP